MKRLYQIIYNLTTLSNAQIAQVATDKNMPEETRNSKVEAVQNEIGQVMAQISELMSQSLEEDEDSA